MTPNEIQYHATQAWVHLSTLMDFKEQLNLNVVSRDVLYKAIMLTHVLSGGEDVRETRSETDTEDINN